MISRREAFMAAAHASLAAMYPARIVERGIQDIAAIGDAALCRGVYQLIAEGTKGWTEFTGREGEYGRLAFSVLADGRLPGAGGSTLDVEQLEAVMEDELLQWVRAQKAEPLDAIYPIECTYSGGLEAPNAWIVMRLEAMYV